jgi:hypothetical protein
MQALFVNSDALGSKIIQYGSDANISHCAVMFRDHHIVYHAYGSKIQRTPIQDFFDKYNLVDFIEFQTTDDQELKILNFLKNSSWYQRYDYPSMIYFAWDRLKSKLFNTKQAKTNPFNMTDDNMCVEVFYIIDDAYKKFCGRNIISYDRDLSMTTPGQLRSILKGLKYDKD